MSLVKSFAVGNGDMYYIRHNGDNFTIIDCSIPSDREGSILTEITTRSKNKGIVRFISTHPDQDHISGLVGLDDTLEILNFYVVRNAAAKSTETADFRRYKTLRDHEKKAYYVYRNCRRRWMNEPSEERDSSGISILWPILNNADFKSALADAAAGETPNNISCIVRYSIKDSGSMIWMGDLETDFMEKIQEEITLPETDVLFAPHHGRASGKVPTKWLEQMNPGLIIIGEAPSEYLHYYDGYNVITQNFMRGRAIRLRRQESSHLCRGPRLRDWRCIPG